MPEPRLLLFPALALSLPARIIPQPTHRPPRAHCLRNAACRRRSPRSPRQVLLQRASLARASMETRCAALLLARAPTRRRPPPKRPVVSQDARLFSWRALRYAAGTASGAAAYARLEQTGRAAVGRESGARGARKDTRRRFLDARRTSQRAHRARPPRKSRRTLTAGARAQVTLAPSGGGGRGAVRSDSLIFVLDAGRFRHALRGLHTREHRSRSVPRGRGVGRQIGDQAKMRRCAQIASARRVAAPHTLNMYSVLVAATAMIFCARGRRRVRCGAGAGRRSRAEAGRRSELKRRT